MAFMMLIIMAALTSMEQGEESGRVHQHLAFPGDMGCSCDKTELCTHLPVVIINTKGQEIPGAITGQRDRFGQSVYTVAEDGSSTITAEITVIANENGNHHPSDTPDFSVSCQFRIRGNSSRRFPKLSYAIKLTDGSGQSKSMAVMGMGAHQDWVLNGPILDKSLIRNYMWYNISGEIMDYAPNVRFCELILNGSYEGLYLMTESITDGENCRLNLSQNVKNGKGTGYLLRVDRPVEQELESVRDIYSYNERMTNTGDDVTIRYPRVSDLTPELAKDFELDFSAFEKALFSYDYDTKDYGYWNWIDTKSFVDYYLINEFTKNVDAGSFSTYIYKEAGSKFKMCVWDFNNACDNYQEVANPPESFFLHEKLWFFMLFKNEDFVEQVLKRYKELRTTYLREEYLMEYIDETIAYLGPALERNNIRWADEIAGWDGLIEKERNVHSQEEAVIQLKKWIRARGRWMDRNIHTLRQYAHPSRNKAYNH